MYAVVKVYDSAWTLNEAIGLTLRGEPEFGASILGGMDTATVPCDPITTSWELRGQVLELYGRGGLVWKGIITNRPRAGEPVQAIGWYALLNWQHAYRLYCDTSLGPWQETERMIRNTDVRVSVDTARLNFHLPAGGPYSSSYYNCMDRDIPSTDSCYLTFTIGGDISSTYSLNVYSGVYNASSGVAGDPYTWTSRAGYTSTGATTLTISATSTGSSSTG